MQRHIEFVVLYCFFFRVSPQEVQVHFVGRFIRRYSGDVQKRSRFIFLDASSEDLLEMYRREQWNTPPGDGSWMRKGSDCDYNINISVVFGDTDSSVTVNQVVVEMVKL